MMIFIKKINTFWQLPLREKGFFFLNYALCGIAKATIYIFSYQKLSKYFGYSHQFTTASTIITPAQQRKAIILRRAIRLASSYTPWDSSCLTQAMVAKFWCNRWHIPYFLFIGLAKNSRPSIEKEAHAWVTAGPLAITGGNCFDTYHVISCFSSMKRTTSVMQEL